MRIVAFSRRLASDERGATLIEYGLIAALVSISIILSLYGVSSSNVAGWNAIHSEVQNAR